MPSVTLEHNAVHHSRPAEIGTDGCRSDIYPLLRIIGILHHHSTASSRHFCQCQADALVFIGRYRGVELPASGTILRQFDVLRVFDLRPRWRNHVIRQGHIVRCTYARTRLAFDFEAGQCESGMSRFTLTPSRGQGNLGDFLVLCEGGRQRCATLVVGSHRAFFPFIIHAHAQRLALSDGGCCAEHHLHTRIVGGADGGQQTPLCGSTTIQCYHVLVTHTGRPVGADAILYYRQRNVVNSPCAHSAEYNC